MNKIILLTILFCGMTMLFAQDQEEIAIPRPLNNIGLNLFGDASIISINYERQFEVKQNFLLSSKLGYGYNEEFQLCIFGPCQPPETYRTIPHHITGNFGKGKHLFEVGLGGTFIMGNTTQPYLLYPIVGRNR